MSEVRSILRTEPARHLVVGIALASSIFCVRFPAATGPLKNPEWSADQVAQWYVHNQGKIKLGAVLTS